MASRFSRLLLIIASSFLLTSVVRAEKIKIVIGDPKTHWSEGKACQGHASEYALTVSKSLRVRLVESGAYSVISRGQLQKILDEHNMAMTGLSDPVNAKILGQFLQADLIMAPEVLCHPNMVELNVILVDVENAEIVWAKNYKMKNLSKVNRALKDIVKLMTEYSQTGSTEASAGKSEDLMMIDSKALHDASENIIEAIENRMPRARGEIKEVNVYAETIKVKVHGDSFPGLKLKVVRDDEEIGWIFLKEAQGGLVEAGSVGDMSMFEEGDQASSEDFRPKVVIGYIEDEDEDNEKLVDLFKAGLLKEMRHSEGLEPVDDEQIDRLLMKAGERLPEKTLVQLFGKQVDLIITGRFSGESGNRRIDFDVLSAMNGKRVIKIKYRSNL